MEYHDVYHTDGAAQVLFNLLAEREPQMNISHRKMPTYEEHAAFVHSIPYPMWVLIWMPLEGKYVGSIYLTKDSEIGIFVFKAAQGRGVGTQAIQWLRTIFPKRRLLANINPANTASIAFFEKHGARHIQNTYILEEDNHEANDRTPS